MTSISALESEGSKEGELEVEVIGAKLEEDAPEVKGGGVGLGDGDLITDSSSNTTPVARNGWVDRKATVLRSALNELDVPIQPVNMPLETRFPKMVHILDLEKSAKEQRGMKEGCVASQGRVSRKMVWARLRGIEHLEMEGPEDQGVKGEGVQDSVTVDMDMDIDDGMSGSMSKVGRSRAGLGSSSWMMTVTGMGSMGWKLEDRGGMCKVVSWDANIGRWVVGIGQHGSEGKKKMSEEKWRECARCYKLKHLEGRESWERGQCTIERMWCRAEEASLGSSKRLALEMWNIEGMRCHFVGDSPPPFLEILQGSNLIWLEKMFSL
ncbi:hypothetical protein F5J12DRAFT_784219 [Pisolithus orientalis]|uniref:uncharacterized protein n=1 Tax=Pisolithus orientalis TaxID=936130 RepID=UPI002224B30C|nr:uncharacterized protein F5J12DRAFT_784219 [Pisolithus orientalis]KAI6000970.1 hypothetical protein F5J12DRAFT_784219 [Pisolithus orientalis]